MKKIVIEPDDKILVTLTLQERDLILNCMILEKHLIEMFKISVIKNNKISLHCTKNDIEDLLGYIAAEANHTPDKKIVNRLDKLYDKLDSLF